MPKPISKGIGKSAAVWLVKQLFRHWPYVVAWLFTSGVLTYLSAASAWIRPWGPVGYASVGFGIGGLLLILMATAYSIYSKARSDAITAAFLRERLKVTGTNTLASEHVRERIELITFFHPHYTPTKAVRFERCQMFGPAMLHLVRCTIDTCTFSNCQVVLVEPVTLVGVVVFDTCMLHECTFYQTTFFVHPDDYARYPDELKNLLPVVSVGKA